MGKMETDFVPVAEAGAPPREELFQEKYMKKSLLVALALACAATAASADIIRVTVVQAANQDDFAFSHTKSPLMPSWA